MSRPAPIVEIPESGYVRTFDAEIDDHSPDKIWVRGVLADHRLALEHTWIVRTPAYEITEASSRHLRPAPCVDPELSHRYPNIRGVRIGRGLTRAVGAALGELEGRREYLVLAIEMARVGQQVYKFPPGFGAGLDNACAGLSGEARTARLAWEKDRAYMPDLANSCYTYRDASAALFSEREVRCTIEGSLLAPEPGQKRVFWRRKELAIAPAPDGAGFDCRNTMEDSIHDIAVELRLDPDGLVSSAQSRGLRLPYHGICEDAQLRTSGLVGKRVDADFVRLIAAEVGGASGCTHLFDLSVDCLRMFEYLD